MFDLAGLRRTHRLTGADDARQVYGATLRDEVLIRLDDAERRIVDLLCTPTPKEGEDSGAVMAGTLRVGRRQTIPASGRGWAYAG